MRVARVRRIGGIRVEPVPAASVVGNAGGYPIGNVLLLFGTNGELFGVQPGIETVLFEQLTMGSALDNPSAIDDKDEVRREYC